MYIIGTILCYTAVTFGAVDAFQVTSRDSELIFPQE